MVQKIYFVLSVPNPENSIMGSKVLEIPWSIFAQFKDHFLQKIGEEPDSITYEQLRDWAFLEDESKMEKRDFSMTDIEKGDIITETDSYYMKYYSVKGKAFFYPPRAAEYRILGGLWYLYD